MLSYNIDQYVFQSQLPQRITIQHNKIKQYYPIQYINQEHVNYFICDQIYKGYYQIQNNYNKICRRLPKELIKKPKNKPNKFSQILQQQQYHEAIANYLENKIEYHLDFNQVMGILTNQNYQDLRQYFMQDITEQILQYYAISHKQYPCLTPKNIKYNTRTQIFKLDIQPIIQQLSGIDHHQLPYKLYPSKKNIFIPQQTQFNQLYEQRLKIMQQYLYFSNDNSNLSQFLMLLHYFDCIYLYKKQTTDHIGENYLKMYLRKQFDINSSPLSQRRLSQSILSQNMNIIKNKLSDKHKNHNNEYNSFIEIDYNNKNRSLITDQLSISDQHFSLKITITKKIFELWLRIKDFSNKNTKQENLWSIILNLLNLYKLIIKCELFIYCQKQKRKLCIIRQIKDIYKIEAKNVLRKQSHKNILRSVVEYAQYLCDRYAKYYGKNVCYYRKYAGTDFIGHQNKILLQIQSQINNLKVQYIQNINYKKYLQIYCDLLMCVRNLKIQNIQYVQYQILGILDKSLKITTKQQYIYQKITQIQAFIQTFKQ